MPRRVRTFASVEEASGEDLTGTAALVIDVLRATTTLCRAFESGARAAWPAVDVPSAFRLADGLAHEGVLLCGERAGVRIPGFDLGNSPLEYTPGRVSGKPLVFASTNGSRALARLKEVARGGIAALLNARAAAAWIGQGSEPVVLLCSGKEGASCREDLLGAGAVLDRWRELGVEFEGCEQSMSAWQDYTRVRADLPGALGECEHARYLTGIGFGQDVELAGQEDVTGMVPRWSEGCLVRGGDGGVGRA